MFINRTVQDAINEQIKHELYAAYLNLAMSTHFEAENFSGFASWTNMQAKEEVENPMKLFGFVNERGGKVVLQAIDQPPSEFGSLLEVFEEILKHEQKVTSLIYMLYEIAQKENYYATQVMMHRFIEE